MDDVGRLGSGDVDADPGFRGREAFGGPGFFFGFFEGKLLRFGPLPFFPGRVDFDRARFAVQDQEIPGADFIGEVFQPVEAGDAAVSREDGHMRGFRPGAGQDAADQVGLLQRKQLGGAQFVGHQDAGRGGEGKGISGKDLRQAGGQPADILAPLPDIGASGGGKEGGEPVRGFGQGLYGAPALLQNQGAGMAGEIRASQDLDFSVHEGGVGIWSRGGPGEPGGELFDGVFQPGGLGGGIRG